MKKIIFSLTIFFIILGLSSCSDSEKGIIVQSNTGVINSGSTSDHKNTSGSIVETKVKKKGCEVIYENVSKSTLKKRKFSFFIEGDCKDKIINGDSTQEGNLLETPNGIKFEIQDGYVSYSFNRLVNFIKNPPEEKGISIKNFLTESININGNLEVNISKYTTFDENNKQVLDNKIIGNFGYFVISNYSESFQKNLTQNDLDETYNELKTILSTIKELQSIEVSYDYETVDLNKIIVQGDTFILRDKNGFEKIIKVDPTRIYRDFTVKEFEDECRRNCRFSAIRGNVLEWEIELLGGNYYSESTDITTGNRISGGFESSGGFDNLD